MLRIFSTIFFLLFGLLFLFFWVLPEYEEMRGAFSELEAKEKELESRSEYISQITGMYELLLENEYEVAKVRNALPPDHHLPSLFLAIREMGAQSGVFVEGFGSFTVREVDDLREVEFTVNVAGRYSGIKTLINRMEDGDDDDEAGISLETLSRIIEIDDARMEYMEDRETRPIEMSITVRAYSY